MRSIETGFFLGWLKVRGSESSPINPAKVSGLKEIFDARGGKRVISIFTGRPLKHKQEEKRI